MADKGKSEFRLWAEMMAALLWVGIALGVGLGLAAGIAISVSRWLGGAP